MLTEVLIVLYLRRLYLKRKERLSLEKPDNTNSFGVEHILKARPQDDPQLDYEGCIPTPR